jgi:FHA domain
MANRLVALDEGSDIPLDRAMVVVGRHPQCDIRLDSLRVSRHHCCMTSDHGEVLVRDLGSTNGIRINGHRVEFGRLKPNDELSIAHIRYRLENGQAHEVTLADTRGKQDLENGQAHEPIEPARAVNLAVNPFSPPAPGTNALAAAVRDLLLPAGMADRCLIQVIVQKQNDAAAVVEHAEAEKHEACRRDSSP